MFQIADAPEQQFTVADPGISKRGGGCGRIFRSGVCFDIPSLILYVFVRSKSSE